MWHVFPHDAPLIVKVQYICDKLSIDPEQPLLEVVAQATSKLKLRVENTPLVLQIDMILDVLLDRTSGAKAPWTPDLLQLKADIHAEMIAQSERAWRAMQEARKQSATATPLHAAAASATARPQVVASRRSAESIRKWLREHCVSSPDAASLAELETLMAEEKAAIEEEQAAMAAYNASMSARGQPTVVSAVSTSGASRTVLDEARAGEEVARREMLADLAAREADALAACPVAVGSALDPVASEQPSSALPAGGVPIVVGEAVAIVDEHRPKGGVAALMNSLRIS
jgi:hypothetical protein